MSVKAEELLIGGCLVAPNMVRFATKHITGADFYDRRLGDVFDIITRMVAGPEKLPVDAMTVADQAAKEGVRGIEFLDLFNFQGQVHSGSSNEYYAQQVKEASMRRDMSALGSALLADSNNPQVSVASTASDALAALSRLLKGDRDGGDDPKLLRELLDVEDRFEWAIPGMLEKGDRLMITAGEGVGKSTILRQIVVMSAAGLQPFTFEPINPVSCLIVDVENTERQWRREVSPMVRNAARFGERNPADHLHIRAGRSLNITKEADLGRVHGWIDDHNPDVLMIGPLYKLVPGGIKGDEEASPVIAALDSIRERGVSLLLEGHAAKATDQNGVRNLSPRGSAALMGWPEFGLGLHFDPSEPEKVTLVRWRGDRQKREWPRELYKGGMFPWTPDTVAPNTRNAMYSAA